MSNLYTTKKNGDKHEKVLYKLPSNAIHGKPMQNVRNRNDVRLVSNRKEVLKMVIRTKLFVTKIIQQ